MSQTRICLSATLKPVKEPRMYWKLAQTFSQTNKYRINIIGFGSKNIPNEENIIFHPLGLNKKSRFFRWQSVWKTFRIWLQVKPEYLIVCSPDLLWFSLLIRIMYGTKIIYDVQENYRLNIKAQSHHPVFMKWVLIGSLWITERVSQLWIHRCILAEKIYQEQLDFLRKPFIILENKFPAQLLSTKTESAPKNQIRLLYTGTISKEYGTDLAIVLFHKLVKTNPDIQLTVIGLCSNASFAKQLEKLSYNHPNIHLVIKAEPIDYETIISQIQQADYGLATYRTNASFAGKLPTKYFEYAANELPILFHTESPSFGELEDNVGHRFDFEEISSVNLLEKLAEKQFFTQAELPAAALWGTDEQSKLISLVN